MRTGDRRLEVTRGRDGRVVLASIGGGMPVGIRMTDAEARAVILALAAEVEGESSPCRSDQGEGSDE